MGLYADLTQQDRDLLAAWERNVRGWVNTYARSLIEARVLVAAADATGGPRSIVSSLTAGEVIPNSSGISGAHDLTKQELAGLVAFLDEVIANSDNDADQQLMTQASGPTAGL